MISMTKDVDFNFIISAVLNAKESALRNSTIFQRVNELSQKKLLPLSNL